MKNNLILLIFVLGFASCNKDDLNCHPKSIDATWTLEKSILIEYFEDLDRNIYSIVDGENIVFEYLHSGAQCDDIYDDEWGERLAFEIPSEKEEFEYVDEEILEIIAFYNQFGAWVSSIQHPINEGLIKGEKISSKKWEVSVSITTPPTNINQEPRTIEFKEVFSK